MLTLKVVNSQNEVVASESDSEVVLVYRGEYQEGDKLVVEVEDDVKYYMLQLDDTIGTTFVYLNQNMEFPIPFNEKKVCYSSKSFSGDVHVLSVRKATAEEIVAYKNVAINLYDCHESVNCFPHASANVETRGESVFAAKNAINGNHANKSHGPWPYESWGINRNPEAIMKIEFGRKVVVDKAIIYTRADFPHDSYWTHATLRCSNGAEIDFDLHKTHLGQLITFEKQEIEWIQIEKLIKADDESPFPALSQIEIYGVEC